MPELEAYMDALRKSGDSVGARITVVADNVPPGWGEPLYDKLDADLAHALMGLNAVKGVEIGDGMQAARQKGTEHRDEITPEGFLSATTPAACSAASRPARPSSPTSRSSPPRRCACRAARSTCTASRSRSSPTAATIPASASAPRPIAEALMAIVLMDHALRHRAQCGDVASGTPVASAKSAQ